MSTEELATFRDEYQKHAELVDEPGRAVTYRVNELTENGAPHCHIYDTANEWQRTKGRISAVPCPLRRRRTYSPALRGGVTVSVTQRSPTHLVRGFVPREAKNHCFRHTFTKRAVLVFTLISREANHKNFKSRLRQIPGSYSFLEILYNNKILITNYQSFSHDHYA